MYKFCFACLSSTLSGKRRSQALLNPSATTLSVLAAIASVFGMSAAHAADTGNLPASYGQALHNIPVAPPQLGWRAPDDDDPNNPAGFDDSEDNGVPDFSTIVQNVKGYELNVFAANPTNEVANVVGWIDFNGDGMFTPEEAAVQTVPPNTIEPTKIRMVWPLLEGVSSDFTGQSYARFRITTDVITPNDFVGTFADGEVEDYEVFIMPDADGDYIADDEDPDDDNDRIPDVVEGFTADSDGDGILDFLDADSDNDLLPDFFEVGPNPESPRDTDADGIPDYLDLDSDNDQNPDSLLLNQDLDGDGIAGDIEGIRDPDGDGILNALDIDSDNDGILDSVETLSDTDGDGIPNFLDLDSDNDGVSDLIEASTGVIDVTDLDRDGDGRLDSYLPHGENGLANTIETEIDSGVTSFLLADSDGDGIADFVDLDSDSDGIPDITELNGVDANNDSLVDMLLDSDGDGLFDVIDIDSNPNSSDIDGDGIIDEADIDFLDGTDSDFDGIEDSRDPDRDGNGLVDTAVGQFVLGDQLPDSDADGIPDLQDAIDGPNSDDTNGNGSNTLGIGGSNSALVQTGLSGGGAGCTIGGSRDPLLLLLVLASAGFLLRRRTARVRVK